MLYSPVGAEYGDNIEWVESWIVPFSERIANPDEWDSIIGKN
jgi:hypothetical protein